MICHINKHLVQNTFKLFRSFLSFLNEFVFDSWIKWLNLLLIRITVPANVILALGASINAKIFIKLLIETITADIAWIVIFVMEIEVLNQIMTLIAFGFFLHGFTIVLQFGNLVLTISISMHNFNTEKLHKDHSSVSESIWSLSKIFDSESFFQSCLDRLIA